MEFSDSDLIFDGFYGDIIEAEANADCLEFRRSDLEAMAAYFNCVLVETV